MDTGTMVNGKELHLKINFKYLTLFQLSLCLGTVLAQASDGLLRRPGAANSLQLPWPLVQRTVIASHRQKISPFGGSGRHRASFLTDTQSTVSFSFRLRLAAAVETI
jgi:hypothetical protein